MKHLVYLLILATALAGCGNSTDSRFEDDLERARVHNQECMADAANLIELDRCQDAFLRRVEQIHNNIKSGYYS